MARTRSQAFGEALKRLRKERDDMSQEAAALSCHIDRAYFGKIERGEKNPTLDVIWRIADGFKTTPSDLLARAERLMGKG